MLGRRSFLLFLSRMLSAALAYVGLYFMTRPPLGPEIYGTISYTLAFVATFNAVADLGFSSAHIKRMSEGADPDECVSTYAAIKVLLTGSMVVLIVFSVIMWTGPMGNTLTDTSIELILLFILYQVLYDLCSIATTTFQAKLEMAKMPLVTLADPLVRLPLVILVALTAGGVMELAYAYVLGAMAALALAMYLLSKEGFKWKRPVLWRSYYSFALPLIVITIVSTVSANADRLIIGTFWTAADVGLYSAPAVFLGVFATVSTAVSTLTFPSFSKLHAEGNLEEIRQMSQMAERYIAMIGLPITILIILFPHEVCRVLLGPLFIDSGDAIGIMAVTNFLVMLNAVHSSQIVAVGRPDISARITIFTVALNIALMFLLIPQFGLGLNFVGAALALMIGNMAGFLLVRYSVWRLTRTSPNPRLLLHLLAGGAAAAAMMVLDMVISIDRFYTLILFGLVAFAVYLPVLALLKEFTRDDLNYFLELINIKKMLVYIRSELKGK